PTLSARGPCSFPQSPHACSRAGTALSSSWTFLCSSCIKTLIPHTGCASRTTGKGNTARWLLGLRQPVVLRFADENVHINGLGIGVPIGQKCICGLNDFFFLLKSISLMSSPLSGHLS